MRQIKNCKVGHFVKYNGVICQVNCFYTGLFGKQATLIQVGGPGETKRMYSPQVTEKVEYLGPVARVDGKIWVPSKRDPIAEWNNR